MNEELMRMFGKAALQEHKVPLTYSTGWIHTKCGGEARRADPPWVGADCFRCGSYAMPLAVPTEELMKDEPGVV